MSLLLLWLSEMQRSESKFERRWPALRENILKSYSKHVIYHHDNHQLYWKGDGEPSIRFQDSMITYLTQLKHCHNAMHDLRYFMSDHIDYMLAVDTELERTKGENQALTTCSDSTYDFLRSRKIQQEMDNNPFAQTTNLISNIIIICIFMETYLYLCSPGFP